MTEKYDKTDAEAEQDVYDGIYIGAICACVYVIFSLFLTAALSGIQMSNKFHKEAVINHVAHWTTDSNGNAVFTWGEK